jgi:hypothetical protein
MTGVAIPASARRDYEIHVALCEDAGGKAVDFETWAMDEGYDVPEADEEPPSPVSDEHPVVLWARNYLFKMPGEPHD